MVIKCDPNHCEFYYGCLDRPDSPANCELLLPWEKDKIEIIEDGRMITFFQHEGARPREHAPKRPFSERQAFIRGLLAEQPHVTNPGIARAANVAESTARRWTGRMVREGDLGVERFGGNRPAIYTLKGE